MLSSVAGWVYVRRHWSYKHKNFNCVKLGECTDLVSRDNVYKTGELERGWFVLAFGFEEERHYSLIEKYLISEFTKCGYHVQHDGGVEFFDDCIIDKKHKKNIWELLQPYQHLIHQELDESQLSELVSMPSEEIPHQLYDRYKFETEKEELQKLAIDYGTSEFKPRPYGQKLLDKLKTKTYSSMKKFTIIWACGLGKTFQSCFIAKQFGAKTICVGVHNVDMIEQFANDVRRIMPTCTILFKGGKHCSSLEQIENEIDKLRTTPLVVITTYHSSYVLTGFHFDFKIADEAHHLASINIFEEQNATERRYFTRFLEINAERTLFMSATKKEIKTIKNNDELIACMDNEEQFGKIISELPMRWAIEEKYITDYNICVHRHNYDFMIDLARRFGIDVETDETYELFIAAFTAIHILNTYSHLNHMIIYANTIHSALQIEQYVETLLSHELIQDICCQTIHSKSKTSIQSILERFEKASKGILINVYMLNEGKNMPYVNCQIFAEPMHSDIRIVQSLCRMLRKDPNNPSKAFKDKLPTVIIPIINDYSLEHTDDIFNDSFKKVVEIIRLLRTHDDSIFQKVKLKEYLKKESEEKEELCLDDIALNVVGNNESKIFQTLLIHSLSASVRDEFEMRRLEYFKRSYMNCQREYRSIQDYRNRESNSANYISNPEEYFMGANVWNGWYDYLGIDTSVFPHTKPEFIQKCHTLGIMNWKQYREYWRKYNLPFEPSKFYDVFGNFNDEIGSRNKRR